MIPSSLLIWLHLISAVSWVGGMVFLSLVLAPAFRAMASKPDAGAFFRMAARRFRLVVWGAVAVLLSTGPLLIVAHGWPLMDPGGWPTPLRIKLGIVVVLLSLTFSHDLVLGPRVRAVLALQAGERSAADRLVLLGATWVPRLSLLLGLGVLWAAVIVARL